MRDAGIAHGGGISEAVERYGGEPSRWLDLSTGINPVPAPLPAIPPTAWQRLPDAGLVRAAEDAAASFYGAGGRPLSVPGIQAAIQHLPMLVTGEGRAAILSPTYGEYGFVLRRAGVGVDEVEALEEIGSRHRLVVVVNPNNPDGRRIAREELLRLARDLQRRGGYLVVDEAFADADPQASLAGEAGGTEGLIVLRSFGKFFGLAGLRLGFVLAPDAILAGFEQALGPWAVPGPALAVAAGLMRDGAALTRLRASIAERHAAMRAVLDRAGLAICGETALFFLVEHRDARALQIALCRRHVLVRSFDYAPSWLRIGLAPDAASDDRFARALAVSAGLS